jgi:DNA-binding transcriptional MerR regulator
MPEPVRPGRDAAHMINPQDRQRIGRARLLRREGKTYDEIRAAIGEVGDDKLRSWLKAIPRPSGTFRGNPKIELRRQCRRLRAEGLTYDEIAAITGASASSLSLWLRDLPLAEDRAREHRLEAVKATCEQTRRTRAAARAAQIAAATSEIGQLSDRELFLVGVGLYWAEGGKSKPWAIRDRVTFINSDPTVIIAFLRWLDLLGVTRSQCRFHVSIHETGDIPGAERYWADLAGVEVSTFNQSSIKRHKPKTVRYNTDVDYRGCLIINVLKSAALYRAVDGWWQGIVLGLPAREPVYALGCQAIYPGSSRGRTGTFGVPNGGSIPPPGANC